MRRRPAPTGGTTRSPMIVYLIISATTALLAGRMIAYGAEDEP